MLNVRCSYQHWFRSSTGLEQGWLNRCCCVQVRVLPEPLLNILPIMDSNPTGNIFKSVTKTTDSDLTKHLFLDNVDLVGQGNLENNASIAQLAERRYS
jgi:hypothetical protein